MAKSISVRHVEKLNIPDGITEVAKANVPLGSIKKSKTIFIAERHKFTVFECEFTKDISEEISVYIQKLENYFDLSHYKKKFSFKIFYSSEKKILFSEAPTPVTKSFLSALENTEGIEFEFKTMHFAFDKVEQLFNQTKGIRFDSNDRGVTQKLFNGNKVDSNSEALSAIQSDSATQIIGVIELLSHPYTVTLTQSGTIMSFTKINDFQDKEFPMLEFAVNLLQKIGML